MSNVTSSFTEFNWLSDDIEQIATKAIQEAANTTRKTQNLSVPTPTVFQRFPNPEPLPQDSIKLTVNALVLAIGGPLNLYILLVQLQKYRLQAKMQRYDLSLAFMLQKIHLNVANLLTIIFYCVGHIAWLATYRWNGGDLMCKISYFCWNFNLHLSSYVVAAIAVDRLRNVKRMESVWKGGTGSSLMGTGNCMKPVKFLLSLAWVLAVAASGPQLFVSKGFSVDIFQDWYQCSTIFEEQRMKEFLKEFQINKFASPNEALYVSEKIYLIFHLMTVFWLPFIIDLLCYTVIIFKMLRYGCITRAPARPPLVELEMSRRLLTEPNIGNGKRVSAPRESIVQDGATPTARPSVVAAKQKTTIRSQIQIKKLFKTAAIVVGAYVVLWCPYNLLALLTLIDKKRFKNLVSNQLDWLNSLILVNCVLNPLFYGFDDFCNKCRKDHPQLTRRR